MYKKVLVAVDLSKDSRRVIDVAMRAANNDKERLHLVHVVEPVAAAYSMDVYAVNISELQQEAINMAEQRLAGVGKELGLAENQVHTVLGPPAPEIRKLVGEVGADAIVIGSHGHSGWKILLGSTAIKVLHGATCDVLTVHVGEE
ncbi:MAG: universal stress protein [Pseudohongiellaceae bacterium]